MSLFNNFSIFFNYSVNIDKITLLIDNHGQLADIDEASVLK